MTILFVLFAFFQTAPAAAGFDLPLVTSLTAFIALPVKFLVDVVRGAFTSLSKIIPIIGIVIGFLFCIVVLIATGTDLNKAVLAQCLIAAVGAQVGAMAVSGAQNAANDRREAAKPGS